MMYSDFERDFEASDGRQRRGRFARFTRGAKKVEPEQVLDYKNVEYLTRLTTAQGKVVSRKRSGFSGQNQRRLALAIKRARFLGLMPYVGKG